MGAFVFELQAVLDDRGRREKRHQGAVAELMRIRLDLEHRVREVQGRMTDGRGGLRAMLIGRVAVDQVRVQATAGLHAVALLQRAAIDLAGLQRRLEAAQADLLKATIARKAVEALRTRRHEAWKSEEKRRQTAQADDLTMMRHARLTQGESAGAAADIESGIDL